MRVTVWAFARGHRQCPGVRVIVAVRSIARRRPREQIAEVHEQQRFVLVDDNGCRGVQGLNVDESGRIPASAARASILTVRSMNSIGWPVATRIRP